MKINQKRFSIGKVIVLDYMNSLASKTLCVYSIKLGMHWSYINTVSALARPKVGVPNLWNLMHDGMRWS